MITPYPAEDSSVCLWTFRRLYEMTAPVVVVVDEQAWSAAGSLALPSPGGQYTGNTFATFGATLWPCPPEAGSAERGRA